MTEVPSMTDLPAPPYDDGSDEPEFRPRPRRRAHVLTFVLAAALLVGAGFYGGVLLQKHEDHGSTSASGGGSGRASRFAAAGGASGASGASGATGASGAAGGGGGRFGGGAGFGGFGGGAGGGSAVAGTVKLVDGTNVYVTDTSGNVVKVTTNGSSQLTKTDPATIKDVAPGDVVTVRGSQNSDGSYTATSLILIPSTATSTTPGG
jgi:hypothetical protein